MHRYPVVAATPVSAASAEELKPSPAACCTAWLLVCCDVMRTCSTRGQQGFTSTVLVQTRAAAVEHPPCPPSPPSHLEHSTWEGARVHVNRSIEAKCSECTTDETAWEEKVFEGQCQRGRGSSSNRVSRTRRCTRGCARVYIGRTGDEASPSKGRILQVSQV